MTHKEYRMIALVILERYSIAIDNEQRLLLRNLAYSMATMLSVENPRFNRDKFLTACGVKNEQPAT